MTGQIIFDFRVLSEQLDEFVGIGLPTRNHCSQFLNSLATDINCLTILVVKYLPYFFHVGSVLNIGFNFLGYPFLISRSWKTSS